jgi:hypothetical protein
MWIAVNFETADEERVARPAPMPAPLMPFAGVIGFASTERDNRFHGNAGRTSRAMQVGKGSYVSNGQITVCRLDFGRVPGSRPLPHTQPSLSFLRPLESAHSKLTILIFVFGRFRRGRKLLTIPPQPS